MDPLTEKTPGLGLPQPSMEGSSAGFELPKPGLTPEVVPASGEFAPRAGAAAPVLQAPPQAIPAVPAPTNPATANPTMSSAMADDDDSDLDQEWIRKAKAIVEQTHTDPYLESHEISKVKADFLKTRYNKVIKVSEDQGQ